MATRKSTVVLRDRSKVVSYKETTSRLKPSSDKAPAVKSGFAKSTIAPTARPVSAKTPVPPTTKPPRSSTGKSFSIQDQSSSRLSINSRVSTPAAAVSTPPTVIQKIATLENRIEELSSREFRFSAVEAANVRLTSEIEKLQETSTKLKDEFERVQFVLLDLIGLDSKLEDSHRTNSRLAAENSELKSELSHLKSEVLNLRNQFGRLPDAHLGTGVSAEQESINANVIIRGIDFEQQPSHDALLEKFDQIRSHLGISTVSDFEPADIGLVHPKTTTDKEFSTLHKTIRVKFHSVDHKRRFLQIRRTKKSIYPSEVGIKQNSRKPILIVEQLTKQNQQLLYKARSLRTSSDFKFVWSNNGQILARHRQGSKVIRIQDLNHIDQLRSQFSTIHTNDGDVRTDLAIEPNSSSTQL